MKDEINTSYVRSASPPGERVSRTAATVSKSEPEDSRVTFAMAKGRDFQPPASIPKGTCFDLMKELNRSASLSANQCRIIGNLPFFSEKIRRALSSKQRFRPGEGIHPLFLSI